MAVAIDLTLYCENARLVAEFWKTALGYVDDIPATEHAAGEESLARFDLLRPGVPKTTASSSATPRATAPGSPSSGSPSGRRRRTGSTSTSACRGTARPPTGGSGSGRRPPGSCAPHGTILEAFDDHILMADPEGNEFRVTAFPA